jgi:hypothetical protein
MAALVDGNIFAVPVLRREPPNFFCKGGVAVAPVGFLLADIGELEAAFIEVSNETFRALAETVRKADVRGGFIKRSFRP